MNQLRIALIGANGRMGQAVCTAAAADSRLTITQKVERTDALAPALQECDVVIDFSTTRVTIDLCQACIDACKPLVIGTTGQSNAEKEKIIAAAREIPLVWAANFSVGVNVLFALTKQAARLLGIDFDCNVIEMHHRTKKDAPSGTARRLEEILEHTSGQKIATPLSIRAGDIVGEHQVIFSGAGERLELIHRAGSRATFAEGALRAAHWIVRQPPGLYAMEDVLGL